MFSTVHRLAVAGGVTIALAAAGSGATASQAAQSATPGDSRPVSGKAARTNESLDTIAELLGRAVGDKALRQQIRDRIVQRGTPDKAVTYRSLSGSSDLRTELAEVYRAERSTSEAEALRAVDELTASLPPTQVSVPVRMGAWNSATVAPLVGYVPAGIDDDALTTITAYDSAGRAHELDAWTAPDQPVIVLGPDETAYHDPGSTASRTSTASRPSSKAALATCYNVRLEYVRLWNDHEPWAKGMAEIFLAAKGPGLWYKDEFTYLEQDGDQVWPDELLGCADDDVRFYWWEDDSGSYDFGLTCCGGFSFGVQMSDEDDLIGGRQLDWATFEGTSNRTTDFTDLEMITN